MAPPIKIRPSYASDATWVGRLRQAVEIDNRVCIETRRTILRQLGALSISLVNADSEIIEAKQLANEKETRTALEIDADERWNQQDG